MTLTSVNLDIITAFVLAIWVAAGVLTVLVQIRDELKKINKRLARGGGDD